MFTVAIVGRPNVGKSSLFNALVRRDLSLVHDRPGVTRDRIVTEVVWRDRALNLIDTGGIGLEDSDGFREAIQREAEIAMELADIIVWVVDAREGLALLDQVLSKYLRKTSKPVLIAANKVDQPGVETRIMEIVRTGFKPVVSVSAAHRAGLDLLIKSIVDLLPPPTEDEAAVVAKMAPRKRSRKKEASTRKQHAANLEANARAALKKEEDAANGAKEKEEEEFEPGDDDEFDVTEFDLEEGELIDEEGEPVAPPVKALRPTRLAILGRPNVGKSSLINAILGDERTIVSPIAGTTRDAVEIPYMRKTDNGLLPYTLVDTAGMRQRSRIGDDLERSMTARSAHALNTADLCVLVVTADTGVTSQDKKIASLIARAQKACIIVVNKWDLTEGLTLKATETRRERKVTPVSFRGDFLKAVQQELFFLDYAPIVFASAKTGFSLDRLFPEIDRVSSYLRTPIPTGELNRFLKQITVQQPPALHGMRRFKILYATAEVTPESYRAPGIIAFCNDVKLLDASYLKFLENRLREKFPLEGCPLRWSWRERIRKNASGID